MEHFAFIQNIQDWSDQFPWLEMLSSLSLLILLAALANFIAKQVVVRGIRKLISKMKFANNEVLSQHSVISRVANIVPAIEWNRDCSISFRKNHYICSNGCASIYFPHHCAGN